MPSGPCSVAVAIDSITEPAEREVLDMVMWEKDGSRWVHSHKDIRAVLEDLAGFDRTYQMVRHHRLKDCSCFQEKGTA